MYHINLDLADRELQHFDLADPERVHAENRLIALKRIYHGLLDDSPIQPSPHLSDFALLGLIGGFEEILHLDARPSSQPRHQRQ